MIPIRFRSRRSRALAALALAVLASGGAGCARPAATTVAFPAGMPVHRVGTWEVGIVNTPDPPRQGDNVITIVVRDRAGRPLVGAVELIASMPAMGTMAAMESRARVSRATPGVWRARYGLAMGGDWEIALRVVPVEGAPAEAAYHLSTRASGLAFTGGTAALDAGTDAAGAPPPEAAPADTGVITLDDARRQEIGVRTAVVGRRLIGGALRVPATVAWDESRRAEVAPRFGGTVRELRADAVGKAVRRGQPLCTVYSPELWGAQQEYLDALTAARADSGRRDLSGPSRDLAEASRRRLALWGLPESWLDAIAASGQAREAVPVTSPVSGVVVEKNVTVGTAFTAGQTLFRIASIDPVWVVASLHPADLIGVRAGMAATIRDPASAGRTWRGRVTFVAPALDAMSRTAEVRIEAPNRDGALRPGQYLEVALAASGTEVLAVPESAVLPGGTRDVVFVDLGGGRLAPRTVRLGRRGEGYVEVLEGVRAGETIVTSGNFLVAAESRLHGAGQTW